jgi:DNA-binding SARP family transcriptional activator
VHVPPIEHLLAGYQPPGWQFGVLGPVAVRLGERLLPVGGPRQRGVLAVLLLHANRVVSVDQLVEALWGQDPPRTATAQVHTAVSTLRKALTRLRTGGGPPAATALRSRPPGYLLAVAPGELDLDVFHAMAAAGRQALAEGEPATAAGHLHAAMALWRGAALEDVADGPYRDREAARLEEERLAALEDRIEADLALGGHRQLVPELHELVAQQPLRERLWGQRLLALYRAGRQADALSAYADLRRLLVEELGLEPAPALQQLQRRILSADPGLALAVPGGRALSSRAGELERLGALLTATAQALRDLGEAVLALGDH